MAKYFLTGGLAGPWKKEKVSNIGGGSVTLTGIFATDPSISITVNNITAAELYAYIDAGKTIKFDLLYGENIIYQRMPIFAQNANNDDYDFWVLGSSGEIFSTGHLNGDDPVVLTPVTD